MEIILKDKNTYILRIEKGKELFEELLSFAKAHNVQAASFAAVGSADEVLLSWYNPEIKGYLDRHFQETLEIANVTGNISLLQGQPYIHAHGCFSNREMQAFGGHIKKLMVGATCEIAMEKLEGKMERAYSQEVGLNLLCNAPVRDS